MMTLNRFGRGLNFGGIESQVFRPIMTAFRCVEGQVVDARRKYAISLGKRHGSNPAAPIPLDMVAARSRVDEDMVFSAKRG